MADSTSQAQTQDAIRQGRELLLRQIRESQETIKRSQELLNRMDELLARTEQEGK
jgi:hypothetical protein